jgi:DNA-binding NtrC family response regulator
MAFSEAERAFMRTVAEVTACNPFTARRESLDRELADEPTSGERALDIAIERVGRFVEGLAGKGRTDLRRAPGSERELLRTVLLFDLYHAYRLQFDDHILRQVAAGEEPLRVEFAAGCLQRLEGYGLSAEEAARSFAAFFQLRRAFYFIHRGLIGRSACMRELRAQLWNNVFTHDFLRYERVLWDRMEDFSTLLLGETGTGKGASAAAIGRSGFIPFDARKGAFRESFAANYVAVNLSQYAAALIESELFGHRKGAFTGAVADHEGVLSRCRPNGAIFLDEVGDLDVPLQIKLLRVLQERVFTPVGSHEERRFAGRVIAATNKPLDELRRGGRFREDFYYRLCSDQVRVPPLRQRLQEDPAELQDLLEHILRRLCGDAGAAMAGDVGDRLRKSVGPDYAWPGNVRELEQAVRSILLKGHYAANGAGSASAPQARAGELAAALECGALSARALLARYCRLLYERSGNYGEVARRTGLDRRTVRKYVTE